MINDFLSIEPPEDPQDDNYAYIAVRIGEIIELLKKHNCSISPDTVYFAPINEEQLDYIYQDLDACIELKELPQMNIVPEYKHKTKHLAIGPMIVQLFKN